jgi:GT2 family glycosyltransferase
MKNNRSIHRLTVGVVTYNNSEMEQDRFFRSYLKALSQVETNISVQLLCLDNGLPSSLSKKEGVCAVPSAENLGFARAVNLQMKIAFEQLGADVFLTCNPDGFFHPQTLVQLLKTANECLPALIEARVFPEEHPKIYDRTSLETPWASGCCLLIPKKLYEMTQGFDEQFFLYMEDVDLSWRAKLLGFSIKHCVEAFYGHGLQGRNEGAQARRKQLLISARLFAEKWGLRSEKLLCERLLEKEYGLDKAALKKKSEPSLVWKKKFSKSILGYTQFFNMCSVRW